MKTFKILVIFILSTNSTFSQQKPPYASDTPISVPQRFEIPGTATAWHITFTPDGNTFYFVSDSSQTEVVKYCNYKDGKWTDAATASFSGKYRIETPHISVDGQKFFFTYASHDTDKIYVMNKTDNGWSEPQNVGYTVNSVARFDAAPSCAGNGNLYFLSNRQGASKIYCSEFKDGKYESPKELASVINRNDLGEPFISPDESYILFPIWSIIGGAFSSDLYISFRKNDTCWTFPKNLGFKINSTFSQLRPYISPDGNYLFFNRNWVYQVDWKPILDSLKKVNSIPYLLSEISGSFEKGEEFSLKVDTFIDDDGDTLKYTAKLANGEELPSWLKFDPEKLTFSGTPESEQILRIKLTATDKHDASGNKTFLLMPKGYSDTIALRKHVSASSFEGDQTLPEFAVDSFPFSRWSSQYEDPQWIKIDLQDIYSVAGVCLNWEAAYATEFKVEVSLDDKNWSTIYNTTKGDGGSDYIFVNPVEARYVRMYGTKRSTGWGYSLWEFQVFGKFLRKAPIVGIQANNVSEHLTISPNPCIDKFQVKYTLQKKSNVEINIYDITGRRIKHSFYLDQNAGNLDFTIDTRQLKAGIYFCDLKTGKAREIKKFSVVK